MYFITGPILFVMLSTAILVYLAAYWLTGVLIARLVPAFRARYRVTRIAVPMVLCGTMWMFGILLELTFMYATALLVPVAVVGVLLTRHLIPPAHWSASEALDAGEIQSL